MSWPPRSAVAVIVALAVAGCSSSSDSGGAPSYPLVSSGSRVTAPSLALSDAREQQLGLPRHSRRQVLVVHLDVPGAVASEAESSVLAKVARQPAAANAQFLSVVEDASSVRRVRFVAQGHVVSYPSDSDIAQSQQAILLAVTGFPTCLVVDRRGRVAARIVGLVDPARLLASIRAVSEED